MALLSERSSRRPSFHTCRRQGLQRESPGGRGIPQRPCVCMHASTLSTPDISDMRYGDQDTESKDLRSGCPSSGRIYKGRPERISNSDFLWALGGGPESPATSRISPSRGVSIRDRTRRRAELRQGGRRWPRAQTPESSSVGQNPHRATEGSPVGGVPDACQRPDVGGQVISQSAPLPSSSPAWDGQSSRGRHAPPTPGRLLSWPAKTRVEARPPRSRLRRT
jgi:hypothetical protein